MGALLGAIITGLIAIFIMYRTIVNNRKQDKKKMINDFLKESHFLLYSVGGLINHTNTYVKYQLEEEKVKRTGRGPLPDSELSEIKEAKRLNETDIAEYLRKIKSVDRNAFPIDAFDIYLDILRITEETVEYFWQRSLKWSVGGVADILEDAIKDLNTLKDALEQKYKEKEKEYNSL